MKKKLTAIDVIDVIDVLPKRRRKAPKPIKRTLAHQLRQLEDAYCTNASFVASQLSKLDDRIRKIERGKIHPGDSTVDHGNVLDRLLKLERERGVIDQVLSGHGDHYNKLHTRLLRLEQVGKNEFNATSDEPAVDVLWRLVDGLTDYTTKRYGRRSL